MKKYLFIIFAVLVVASGCSKKKEGTKSQTSTSAFVPPADGRITTDMADKYIKVSKTINKKVLAQSQKIEAFRNKYKLSEGMTELLDSTYVKAHPGVVKEWENLNKSWEKKQNEIYKNIGMSEEEFNWIAGQLIDPKNADMQKYIEKAFSSDTTEKNIPGKK